MYVEIDDFKLHYQVIGEGKPILFLHGLFGISDGMMEIFEPIFRKYDGWKRIYLDSPGNGKSDAPEWMITSDHVLVAVDSFVEQVIADSSFALVGYSFGGYLSLGLLHKRFHQIEGLLLLCPLVESEESKRHIAKCELRKVDLEFFNSLDENVQDGLRQGAAVYLDLSVFERAEKIYTPAFQVANEQFLNRLKKEAYGLSFDLYSFPEKYQKPTLILTGRQDNSVGYRDAWKLESQFERATYIVMDAAGHGLPLDQDMLFTTLVHEWIERIHFFESDMDVNSPRLSE